MGRSSKLQESSSCGDGRVFRIRFAAANAAAISVKQKFCEFKLKAKGLGVTHLDQNSMTAQHLCYLVRLRDIPPLRLALETIFHCRGDDIVR